MVILFMSKAQLYIIYIPLFSKVTVLRSKESADRSMHWFLYSFGALVHPSNRVSILVHVLCHKKDVRSNLEVHPHLNTSPFYVSDYVVKDHKIGDN